MGYICNNQSSKAHWFQFGSSSTQVLFPTAEYSVDSSQTYFPPDLGLVKLYIPVELIVQLYTPWLGMHYCKINLV